MGTDDGRSPRMDTVDPVRRRVHQGHTVLVLCTAPNGHLKSAQLTLRSGAMPREAVQ